MRKIFLLVWSTLFLGAGLVNAGEKAETIYDLTVSTLEGKPQPLGLYKGKVALVVNLASKCGYTRQYTGLEALYQEYKDKGFVILGFPSNDFGGQEPGTAEEILTFCSTKYQVTFPLFEKIVTKGEAAGPVYKLLNAAQGAPKWNFHKYLIGKDGRVLAAFESKIAPESAELRQAIDAALK